MERISLSGSGSFSNNQPWHNEYKRDAGNIGNESLVEKVVVCATGLMIISSEFKDFVYEGKQVYDQILEALNYFISRPNEGVPFLMICTKNKSADLAPMLDYEGDGVWYKDNKSFIFKKGKEEQDSQHSLNPFMPPTIARENAKSTGTRKPRKSS